MAANELQLAFNEIAEMRALPPEVVLEALQTALVSAYRRDANASAAQAIEARIDPATGRARIFVEKEVTEDVNSPYFSPATEVSLEKARFYNPEAQVGDTVMVQVEHTTKKFGRIAAQTAKQVILQKIREAERNTLYEEFVGRVGDIMTGTVQNVTPHKVTLTIGRTESQLPRNQQIPGERYRQHEKIRVLILEVKRANRGPEIIATRAHRNMLRRLLEYEVPEIYNGQVEIKSIAREAGYRSKVAVVALQDGIDPVGACVGMRGIRIQNIVKELHDEKIDVIEWSNDARAFITKALSPARVAGVYLEDDNFTGRTAVVVVPDDQLSLAIGREGQNARLAAKLTGWRIDIKSVSETVQSALENLDMPPLSDLQRTHTALIEDAQRVLDKKNNNKTVMPEEFDRLAKFADVVERRLLSQREEERLAELEKFNAVKATLPPELFMVPITALATLPEDILEALEPIGNVGTLTVSLLVDEDRLRKLVNKISDQPLVKIQNALDLLMETVTDFSDLIEVPSETVVEYEPEPQPEPVQKIVPVTPVKAAPQPKVEVVVDDQEEEVSDEDVEELLDTFGGVITKADKQQMREAEPKFEEDLDEDEDEEIGDVEDEDDDDDSGTTNAQGKKKDKKKRRQLVFDEETGEVVSKRRRKSNRKRKEWDNEEF